MSVVQVVVFGARSARFFQGFSHFWHLKSRFFAGLAGPPANSGQILSSSGAKSLPKFLTSGVLNAGPRVYLVEVQYCDAKKREKG